MRDEFTTTFDFDLTERGVVIVPDLRARVTIVSEMLRPDEPEPMYRITSAWLENQNRPNDWVKCSAFLRDMIAADIYRQKEAEVIAAIHGRYHGEGEG